MANNVNWLSVGFESNPFGIVPDIDQENVIWAGFRKNKDKFDSIMRNCLTSEESNLILNLSRWGGGKTHTSVYYSKSENLPEIATRFTIPLNLIVITPKEGGYGAEEFYTKVIESLTLEKISSVVKSLKADKGENESLALLKKWSNSEDIGRVIWLLGDENMDLVFGAEQLLFSAATATIRNKLRIRRNVDSINDKFQILSSIVKIFCRYDENGLLELPRRVFLWIDELESLIYYTSKQFRPFTQALRFFFDSTQTYLSIFLNFSFSEPSDIQNIEFVIGAALLDRVTEKVIFDEASIEDALEYIDDLFRHFRVDGSTLETYYPFTQDSLTRLLELAPNQTGLPLMPRTINKWCFFAIKKAYDAQIFNDPLRLIDTSFVERLNYKNAID